MALFDKKDEQLVERMASERARFQKALDDMHAKASQTEASKAQEKAGERMREIEPVAGDGNAVILAKLAELDARLTVIENVVADTSAKVGSQDSRLNDIKTTVDSIYSVIGGDF